MSEIGSDDDMENAATTEVIRECIGARKIRSLTKTEEAVLDLLKQLRRLKRLPTHHLLRTPFRLRLEREHHERFIGVLRECVGVTTPIRYTQDTSWISISLPEYLNDEAWLSIEYKIRGILYAYKFFIENSQISSTPIGGERDHVTV